MERKGARRFQVLDLLQEEGGAAAGTAARVGAQTGVPDADVYGVSTFYSLLRKPGRRTRVCQGLTCKLAGSDARVAALRATGEEVEEVSCLGQCDRAPVGLDADHEALLWGEPGSISPADTDLPMNLAGDDDFSFSALARARELGPNAVIAELKAGGLQGRGGAGFPAHFKWNAVRTQPPGDSYVVVNADEGEPGTFKDREVMLRRPGLMLEGAAIAAYVAGAAVLFIYVRGEFKDCIRSLEGAITAAADHLDWLDIRIVEGHGAYICGEETALLEAIEGRRGMPRLKPPYPTESGLWGKSTLMNNVETLACVPSIVTRGGDWFAAQGKTEPGSKLYCVSGHVGRPGVYELPLGVTLDELVEAAGGYVGTPQAFSPGGASSGFLPMSFRDTPLDFGGLVKAGSMFGSSGLVVLNDTIDMAMAARHGLVFFEDESCGQCTPCRVGCVVQRQSLDRYLETGDASHLEHAEDVAWEMDEGSICGLGMVASWPLTTAMKHFPAAFEDRTIDE
ncbi:MAG: NADH-quinone oxidoreductase subunit F [Proteobacteria bacterium]|nr:NADH-quinone oxidoreductase subunit F [Pseudomonadota bacterium]